jgi:hypothetical protein
MRTPLTQSALCLSSLLLLLGACDQGRMEPPVPQLAPVQVPSGGSPAQAADTSVPSADSAQASANSMPRPGGATGRSNDAMTRAQESGAMPMAGQNNDHSAPLAASGPASTR